MKGVKIPVVGIIKIGSWSLLENGTPSHPSPGAGISNLLLEDRQNLLLENGGVILLETEVVKQLNI